jgi:diacylglycerol kinase family enzyme
MYFYLYDSFLQDKKYDKLIGEIEARLIDLSIQGRTAKLNILNDMKETIADAVKHGAQTVVVLGDDKTVSKAINSIVDLEVILGIIPLGREHTLTGHLGIPEGIAACEVLSQRLKEQIDVARVNGNYFTFYLKALSPNIKIISPDRKYSITPMSPDMQISVCNFKPSDFKLLKEEPCSSFFVPQDGRLELVIKGTPDSSLLDKIFSKKVNKIGDYTILPFQKIRLESSQPDKEVKLILDSDKIIKTPAEIEVLPRKVKVIVGKERVF